jgi:hypothetical protein
LPMKAVSVNRRRDDDTVPSRHLLERLRNQSAGRPRSEKQTDNERNKVGEVGKLIWDGAVEAVEGEVDDLERGELGRAG